MATYASRSAWDVRDRARALAAGRLATPAGLGLLCALSLLLRSRELWIGFWIDEGLSVGIADRPLSHIPTALHEDGSPPVYYMLLHFWMAVSFAFPRTVAKSFCSISGPPGASPAAKRLHILSNCRRSTETAACRSSGFPWMTVPIQFIPFINNSI